MAEVPLKKKIARRLEKFADELESGNYHSECSNMSKLATAFSEEKLPSTPEVETVIKYMIKNWDFW